MNIPIYEPQSGGATEVYYLPRQRGGGGFKKMGSSILRTVKSSAQKIGNEAINRGAQAMDNVAKEVMDGKDLTEAVKDETTKAKVDLKRKSNEYASKVGSVRKKLKKSGTRQKFARSAVNALFD